MSDRIQKVIDNLLDEAVIAASQSEWAEVARICGEVTNLDDDNSEATRLLKAAEANLKQVIELPTVVPTTAEETTVRSSFIPLADRAKWAQITVGITVAALLVSIFSAIYEINFMYYLMNWDSLSVSERAIATTSQYGHLPWYDNPVLLERLDRVLNFQMWTGWLFLGAFLSSGVTFLMWLQPASRNLPALGVTDQRFSPGWVVGWWFVPIWSFYKPYQILKEVWFGSGGKGTVIGTVEIWPWLGWFWGTHLAGHLIGNVVARRLGRDTVNSMLAGDYVSILTYGLLIFAGVLLYKFIVVVTDRQTNAYYERRKQSEQNPAVSIRTTLGLSGE